MLNNLVAFTFETVFKIGMLGAIINVVFAQRADLTVLFFYKYINKY